ncbi:MAG: hypothetical protein ABIJ09_08420 [Pseudomonadota bacterium]
MKRLAVVVCAASSMWLLACENVDSEDVMTSGVYADISATADGAGQSLVKASLRVGGGASNTYLDLMGNDKLVASQDTTDKDMVKRTLLGAVWYEATFDADAADTPFKVAFTRTVDDGAPESTLTLPTPFAITVPAADAQFSRASDDITVTWDPGSSSDTMHLTADGDCIQIWTKDLDGDAGTAVIPHAEIVAHENQEATTCTVTVTVGRRRAGTLDTGYGEGGVVWGIQQRTIKIKSAP